MRTTIATFLNLIQNAQNRGSVEQEIHELAGRPYNENSNEIIRSTDDSYLLSKLRAGLFRKDRMSVIGQDDRF
jgi:hypothetical protein